MMFLDTAFLGALFMKNDQWHDAAQRWAARAQPPLITTDYVLIELADGMARRAWRPTFERVLQFLRGKPAIRIIPQSGGLFKRGLEMYRSRLDKEWSLTDCLSFVVMEDEDCSEALTSDLHFVQAGFRALLRETP